MRTGITTVMTIPTIPTNLSSRIVEAFGPDSQTWISNSAALMGELCQRWEIAPVRLLNSSYSLVVEVRNKAGTPAILKLSYPGDESRSQIHALRAFDGNGCVRMLKEDLDTGGILLKMIEPGHSLLEHFKDSRDGQATHIAADLMEVLRGCGEPGEKEGLIRIVDWSRGWERARNMFVTRLFPRFRYSMPVLSHRYCAIVSFPK